MEAVNTSQGVRGRYRNQRYVMHHLARRWYNAFLQTSEFWQVRATARRPLRLRVRCEFC